MNKNVMTNTPEISRDSFVFYRSFFEAIDNCSIDIQRNIYRGICVYALNGEEPQLEGVEKAIFTMAKPQLDRNTKRFLNGCSGGSLNGKSNNPNGRRGKLPKNYQETTKELPNVNDNDNVNDNNKESNRENAMRFLPPSLAEVEVYCMENHFVIDAGAFVDFYESKGWLVGKNKMKDWKAAVRTWWRKNKEQSKEDSSGVSIVLESNSVDKFNEDKNKLWK